MSAGQAPGRPENKVRYNAFLEACDIILKGDNHHIISDFVKVMEEKLTGTGLYAYSPNYLKRKLLELVGENMEVSPESGKSDILTYRPNDSLILCVCTECFSVVRQVKNEKTIRIGRSLIERGLSKNGCLTRKKVSLD